MSNLASNGINSNNSKPFNNFNQSGNRFMNNNSNLNQKKFNDLEITEARESLKFLNNKFGSINNNYDENKSNNSITTSSTITSNFSNNSNNYQSGKKDLNNNSNNKLFKNFDNYEAELDKKLAVKNRLESKRSETNNFNNNQNTNNNKSNINNSVKSKRLESEEEVNDDMRPAFSQTCQGFYKYNKI